MQIPVSMAVKKDDFLEKGISIANDIPQLGHDYCLCTEPEFFDLDDDNYPERIRGYSSHMDILYELRDGKRSTSISLFDSKELYPDYVQEEGKSNIYIFAPLNYLNYVIGYIGIKNSPKLLFNLELFDFVNNMDALLYTMRSHIISERKSQELKRIYMRDALTGIYNRTGCQKVLYDRISSLKEQGKKAIFVFTDIDRMKTINDVYGHLKGDFAIKATAEAFKSCSPKDWLFGRYGGDEFIAVGSCPDPDSVENLIKQISEDMSKQFKELDLSFILHSSIGYTIIEPDDDATIEEYIDRADKYMYAEKEKYHKYIDSHSPTSKLI